MDEVPETSAAREELRRRALDDPIYTKTLISDDARVAAINITFQPMTDSEFVALDIDGRVDALIAEEASESRRFYVAGRPHVRSQAFHLIVRDMSTLVPIAVAVAAFVVWLMSGNFFLGLILALAMVINMLVAAIAATVIPIALRALRIDPALASAVFITTLTDFSDRWATLQAHRAAK